MNQRVKEKTVIIGSGNWGTTLAYILGKNNRVSLWTMTKLEAMEINRLRENKKYLPGVRLPNSIKAMEVFSEDINENDIILIVLPSNALSSFLDKLQSIYKGQIIVNATKGFEHLSLKTMSQIITEKLGKAPVVVLSGPNIAREVSAGKPTKAVLASEDLHAINTVAKIFKNDLLFFEASRDIVGVELCAALKGVLAIGVGIADGLDLGINFIGLLITYGLKEFSTIAQLLNVSSVTIYGIAGLGDLIATCLSENSRNRQFGKLLAQGFPVNEALEKVGMVVEGVQMCKTITELENINISLPIFSIINKIIFHPNGYLPDKFIKCLTDYSS